MSPRNVARTFVRGVVLLLVAFPIAAYAETLPFVGEINDRQVNVRSGPSTNYYVMTRLQAGARVQVVAEESGWYGIVPPEGCYSLISKEYVDIGENGAGVVNGSAVRVRAGSDLDAHRYAVQTKLNKGDVVTVLGDADGGFLKIAPPDAARVWVHSDYVVRVSGDGTTPAPVEAATASATRPAPAPEMPAQPSPSDPGVVITEEMPADPMTGEPDMTTGEVTTPEDAAPAPAMPEATDPSVTTTPTAPGELSKPVTSTRIVTTPSGTSPAPSAGSLPAVITREPDPSVLPAPTAPRPAPATAVWHNRLTDADAAFKAEMAKPLADRNYAGLIPLYRPLADQSEDQVVKLVAQRRIAQLEANMTVAVVLREIEMIATEAERDRVSFADGREKIRKPLRTATEGYEAIGEFRESLVFDTPTGPRRYRLVDPNLTLPRTICYVEFPPDLAVDVNAFLGRMVAIKAREKYIETGDVDPIPVIVVQEIAIAPAGTGAQVYGAEEFAAPPTTVVVPPPASAVDLAPPPPSPPITESRPTTPGNYVTLPSTGSSTTTTSPTTTTPPAPATQSNPPAARSSEPQIGTMVPVTSSGR